MGRLIYIILVACVCCMIMSACGKSEDNDELSQQNGLYGVTEDKLFEIGAQIYPEVSDELPSEYMISEKIDIETATAYEDKIYLVETFRESGVDYVDIGQLDRVLREYDGAGNVCSETQLKPIVDLLGITSEIKKIIVGDKYAVLEDENEHVVILKKTDTGYEMDSKHLLNPKHYVSVMDYEGNMVCLKSSVDDSFYLFDMGKGEMYDLKLGVDGVETVMIGEDKMLLQADGELYVVEMK